MQKRQRNNASLIPRGTASRLSRYLRHLEDLQGRAAATTSSQELGNAIGVTAAQVRKDLGLFGQFGFPGLGYKISNLIPEIKRILGTDRTWNVALVGIGNLGTALLRYKGFAAHGFRIVGIFDASPRLIGRQVEDLVVEPVERAPQLVREKGIDLAILAVPAPAAQEVAEKLVAAGIRGIYNFAPAKIELPEEVGYVSIDLAVELEQLAFLVSHRERETTRRPAPAEEAG